MLVLTSLKTYLSIFSFLVRKQFSIWNEWLFTFCSTLSTFYHATRYTVKLRTVMVLQNILLLTLTFAWYILSMVLLLYNFLLLVWSHIITLCNRNHWKALQPIMNCNIFIFVNFFLIFLGKSTTLLFLFEIKLGLYDDWLPDRQKERVTNYTSY